jgi:HSP20 family molecular chaperone IbpA
MMWDSEEKKGPKFDWDSFQNQFFSEGVWKQALDNGNIGKLPWVENYVQKMIADIMPAGGTETPPAKSSKLSSSTYNIFETHNLLIARIKVSEKINPERIRVQVSTNKLKLLGLLDGDDEEKVLNLPKNVRMNACSAVVKDNVMEIRMAKQTGEQFREIAVKCL